MEIEIRAAETADWMEVERLVEELALMDGVKPAFPPGFTAAYIEDPQTEVLLAFRDGRAVGLLSCWIHPNLYHAGLVCQIEELVVLEGERGQGTGSRLIEAAVRLAERRGCAEISVSTSLSNHAAAKLYRRHSFTDEALLLERHFGGG